MPIKYSTLKRDRKINFRRCKYTRTSSKNSPLKFEQGVTIEASNELEMTRHYENYPYAHLCDRSLYGGAVFLLYCRSSILSGLEGDLLSSVFIMH
jgi:hypothetical protein